MTGEESTDGSASPRRLSLGLIVGVIIVPVIFFWFLLRPGYSFQVRLGGFLLLMMTFALFALRLAGAG